MHPCPWRGYLDASHDCIIYQCIKSKCSDLVQASDQVEWLPGYLVKASCSSEFLFFSTPSPFAKGKHTGLDF